MIAATLAGVEVVVRPATVEDADGMGQAHVLAWQAAYVGMMPQDYLDRLEAGQRAEMWRRTLSQLPTGTTQDAGPSQDQ